MLSIDDEPSNFHKEAACLCENLKDGKCSIYDAKPETCTSYYCMWMVNHQDRFKPADRPDLSGILITMNNPDSDWVKFSGIPSFTAYETKEDAFNGYWGQKLLNKLAKHWLVIIMPWSARQTKFKVTETTRFIGPAKAINLVMKFHKLEEVRHGKG